MHANIRSATFWAAVKEYVAFNKRVCSAIHDLGSPSATLSDTARAFLEIDVGIQMLALKDYINLFSNDDVAAEVVFLQVQIKWAGRLTKGTTDQQCLALLLDPRPGMRQFVAREKLLGTAAGEDQGASSFLQRAINSLSEFADLCVLHTEVAEKHQNKASKTFLLKQQLLAYLGTQPGRSLSQLGVKQEQLDSVVDEEAPSEFWRFVSPKVQLRRVALRLFAGKSAATGTERVWSHFGQGFTAARRRMTSSLLAKLTYVKVNMSLIDDAAWLEGLGVTNLNDPGEFKSLCQMVQELDDEQFVNDLKQKQAAAASRIDEVVSVDSAVPTGSEPEEVDWMAGCE